MPASSREVMQRIEIRNAEVPTMVPGNECFFGDMRLVQKERQFHTFFNHFAKNRKDLCYPPALAVTADRARACPFIGRAAKPGTRTTNTVPWPGVLRTSQWPRNARTCA